MKYTLNGNELVEVSEEKDLGIYISNDLKWGKQCNIAAAKANRILGRLKHAFNYTDIESFKLLYISLVRPHLKYAIQVYGIHILKKLLKFWKKFSTEQQKLNI